MEYESIGRKIREVRESLHLTQEQLAEKLDISKSYLSALERGVKKPGLMTVINVCNTLDISVDTLLDEVVKNGYKTKASVLSEKLENTTPEKRKLVLKVAELILDVEKY